MELSERQRSKSGKSGQELARGLPAPPDPVSPPGFVAPLLPDRASGRHEVVRLTEAGPGYTPVLLVRDGNLRSHHRVHCRGEAVRAHGEGEALLHRSWDVPHGELALLGLTDPAGLGALLDVSSAVAAGVGVRGRDDFPSGKH